MLHLLEQSEARLAFGLADDGPPLVAQHAPPTGRPFLHPLRTRDLRRVLTEDAPPHHPWQHGLSIGLNDVNGWGFWTEGLYEPHRAIDGRFRSGPLRLLTHNRTAASWLTTTEYLTPPGEVVLRETEHWELRLRPADYTLDLVWTLTAGPDVRFGQYAYGGPFLRMPYQPPTPVWLLTDAGPTTPAEADGQPARWLALALDGGPGEPGGGVAILSHPSSPVDPIPWRVDGQYGVGPSRCIAGAWDLPAGATAIERYRFMIFTGRPAATAVAQEHASYQRKTGPW